MFPMYFYSENNTRWLFQNSIINNTQSDTINTLFVGDSRLNTGIDIMQFDNAWQLSIGGASTIEMYYSLKKYLKNNRKPDTIYMSFSARSLIGVFSFWEYAVRNNLFTYSDIKEILMTSKKIENHRTLRKKASLQYKKEKELYIFNPYIKFFLYKINFIKYYQNDIKNNSIFFAKKDNELFFEELTKYKGHRKYKYYHKTNDYLNYESNLKSFDYSKLLNYYLDLIFDVCRKNDIHVVYFTCPINASSFDKLNKNFKTEYLDYINHYKKKYREFNISDTIISFDNSCYGDASHFNSKGQKKNTNYLINYLQ